MKFFAADDLIGFVSFARDQYDIVWFCPRNRLMNRFAAVGDSEKRAIGFLQSNFDFLDDLQRIFCARIVGCNDYQIAVLSGDFAHRLAFRFVAVAAAAENRDDLSVCQFPRRLQRI